METVERQNSEKDQMNESVENNERDTSTDNSFVTDENLGVSESKDYSSHDKAQLLEELRTLAKNSADKVKNEVETIKSAFYKLVKQGIEEAEKLVENTGEAVEAVVDPIENEFKLLINKYKAERAEIARNSEAKKEENHKKKLQIIEELKELLNEEENLNNTFQKFNEIQIRWKEAGQVPQSFVKDLWDTWHHYVEKFYDYVKINKELRDLDIKRNTEVKEDLINKAEELLNNPSINEAFMQLQDLHNIWRETGPVAREQKDTIWDKFKDITSQINKRHQAFFEQRKEEQQRNLLLKIELCEEAEKLDTETNADSKNWQKASDRLLELIEKWKGIGFVPQKENGEVYSRFKKARDSFFGKRKEYYKQEKIKVQGNIKEKKELCEQAEALMNSEDWKSVTDTLIQLQKKWKTTGPVPRKISDALWNRFRAACDTFFNRKAENFSKQDGEYEVNLTAKEQLIAEIEMFTLSGDNNADFETLKGFQLRWREIGFVPIKDKEKIQQKYQTVIDAKFKELKISDADRKMLRFKDKISNLNTAGKNDRVIRSERDKLYNKIMQLEGDINLWENNIGFFAKSKNADAMIADIQKKIEKTRADIKLMEDQIKLIDNKYQE